MPSREQQVLSLIRDDPMLPQQAIAERLGMSRSAVAGHIMKLTHKGLIKGRGYVLSEAPFVTAIGGANIDIHGRSNAPLLHHDSNPGRVSLSAGGVARNVAENLARLGVDCRLVSAVGSDHHGRMLMRLSREAGINMQNVHEIAGATTSTYLSVLDDGGDMLVGINDMSIIEQLGADLLQAQQAMLRQSSAVVLDCNLSDDALAWLTGSLTESPIFVDTVSAIKAPRIRPYLLAVHTLKTGTLEVEALTGLEARTLPRLRRAADWLHRQGVQRVFVTRGKQGVFYSTGDADGARKPTQRSRKMQNAGGAGDAFLAGLVYAWLEDRSLDEAVGFALAAAEITVAHPATSSPALSLTAVNERVEVARAR